MTMETLVLEGTSLVNSGSARDFAASNREPQKVWRGTLKHVQGGRAREAPSYQEAWGGGGGLMGACPAHLSALRT